jgi:serine/threonine protein kinase
VHADVKPSNVLVETPFRAVIADFGISRLAQEATVTHFGVTTQYAAPELLIDGKPTLASDIFSLALTIHFILTGRHFIPSGTREAAVYEMLRSGRRPGRPSGVPRELRKLLERMWHFDAAGRPTSRDVQDTIMALERCCFRSVDAKQVSGLLPFHERAQEAGATAATRSDALGLVWECDALRLQLRDLAEKLEAERKGFGQGKGRPGGGAGGPEA